MALLVRAGLPSRVAAQAVVEQLQPAIVTREDMVQWLRSPVVEALSIYPAWPSQETEGVWRRFRQETLAASDGRWSTQEWSLDLPPGTDVNPAYPGRIAFDMQNGNVSITTADYRSVVNIHQRLDEHPPSSYQVTFSADRTKAHITRIGRGNINWAQAQ
jgi:hypothetical protein